MKGLIREHRIVTGISALVFVVVAFFVGLGIFQKFDSKPKIAAIDPHEHEYERTARIAQLTDADLPLSSISIDSPHSTAASPVSRPHPFVASQNEQTMLAGLNAGWEGFNQGLNNADLFATAQQLGVLARQTALFFAAEPAEQVELEDAIYGSIAKRGDEYIRDKSRFITVLIQTNNLTSSEAFWIFLQEYFADQ
jgi:hypothetical protein